MDSSGKSLGRASIEAYAGIGIAIIAVVLPMTWYWKAILIVTLSALVVDLAFRSPVTSSWRKALKTGVSLAAVALIWAISWKPLLEQYGVDSTVNHPEPNVHPLWALITWLRGLPSPWIDRALGALTAVLAIILAFSTVVIWRMVRGRKTSTPRNWPGASARK